MRNINAHENSPADAEHNIYTNGTYLRKNPLWHIEESPFKVRQIVKILRKNRLHPQTICEVGCGAGEVLRLLQQQMNAGCHFRGYQLLDYFFTPRCIELGNEIIQKIARLPRKLCFSIHQDMTVRFLGGYSLLVLAR
jgi:hypothetical protein